MRYKPRWVRLVPILVVAVILILPTYSKAQIGGTIGYGSSVFGSLAAGQSLTYSFNGTTGDLAQVMIRNWTGTLHPRLDLVAPDGQTIASSILSPFSEDPLESSLSLFLPQTGIYSLQVSGESDTAGDFVLKLKGRGLVEAIPLLYGQNLDVNIPIDPAPQYFTIDTQTCPTVFTITNPSAGQPFTFPFVITVLNPLGVEITQFYGGDALEDRMMLPASSGRYDVTVTSDDPQAQGMIQLLVTCMDQPPGCIPGSQTRGVSSVCPSCFDVGPCSDFDITYTLDGNTATFTWPPMDGADWYIFSLIDAASTLLMDSPRIREGETNNTYTFDPADVPRGPFTAVVQAGSESEGSLCLGTVLVSLDGTGECTGISVGTDAVPGAARAAVAHWDAVSGAAAYLLHIYAYAEDSSLIGIRVLTVPGDATTYHLSDVFPSDYERFRVEVDAYSEASGGGAFGDMPQGYLCGGGADIEFEPTGPVQWGVAP